MIPNHKQFLEAIHEQKKVCVRFYSRADDRMLDRVCAPMDYGLGGEIRNWLNRYWIWDCANNTGLHTLGLLPQQILDLQVLGEVFDPAQFDVQPPQWTIPRTCDSQPQLMDGANHCAHVIPRRCPYRWRAGATTGNRTRQQEMKP